MLRPRPVRRRLALTAATALLLAGCGGDDPTVEIEPPEEVTPEETAEPEPDETEPPATDDGVDAGADDDGQATDESPSVGPTPDPALVADPCAEDQGREDEGFITVVSPVAEQLVTGDSVDLVGCSNVFEANVQWSLYDGDGRELDSGFTTAECGSGCVGAFAEEISLESAAGEPYAELHVYSEDMSDGESDLADADGRLHTVAIPLVLG
ncbi:Gmad2 immunoglobulin-like domain-containing protein [Nitriliruptor alkaliphilus]|uniref:Gmad2 immunoglobulin-like domain-containing protein n=1 Tax=Nitriliruptor alkaliphilus TaxID=427918 RepID=UPI0006981F98|nr:Gmad2 immunoglobulin-like domain-containing protein [Nitriliruptor alkaliphilus]